MGIEVDPIRILLVASARVRYVPNVIVREFTPNGTVAFRTTETASSISGGKKEFLENPNTKSRVVNGLLRRRVNKIFRCSQILPSGFKMVSIDDHN